MPSKFHKTTSECWQRTSGTQKSSPLSSKGGRKKYKRQKKRQKREGHGAPSREGSLKKREVSKHQETFSLPSLCQALEAQRATKQGGKINKQLKPTDYVPNGNSPSGEAEQTPAFTVSKRRLGRKVRAALLRVRTGPERPEGNLRELIWASKPDCGITTMRKALT